jgi:hypothetical protein
VSIIATKDAKFFINDKRPHDTDPDDK